MIENKRFKKVEKIGEKTFGWLKLPAIISKNNVRQTEMTLKSIEPLEQRLADNINEIGLQQLPVVNGKGEVFIGGRRIKACTINGEDHVLVEIRDISDLDQKLASYSENKQKQEMTADEEGRLFKAIIEEEGISQVELAKKLGEPRTLIVTRMQIAKYVEGRQVPYGTGDPSEKKIVTASKAEKICQDSIPKDAREKMFKLIEKDGMTQEEVIRAISVSKGTLHTLSEKEPEVKKLALKMIDNLMWTSELTQDIANRAIYVAEGDIPKLSKKTYPLDKFKDRTEADQYAGKYHGRCNGTVTVERWALELDTVGEKLDLNAEKKEE